MDEGKERDRRARNKDGWEIASTWGPRSVPLRVVMGDAAERILGISAIAMSRFS